MCLFTVQFQVIIFDLEDGGSEFSRVIFDLMNPKTLRKAMPRVKKLCIEGPSVFISVLPPILHSWDGWSDGIRFSNVRAKSLL